MIEKLQRFEVKTLKRHAPMLLQSIMVLQYIAGVQVFRYCWPPNHYNYIFLKFEAILIYSLQVFLKYC